MTKEKGPNLPFEGTDTGLMKTLSELTVEQRRQALRILTREQNEYTETTLNDLKENHIKVEENVNFMGQKGKKVSIDLPVIGKFKGAKFEYFLSDFPITGTKFTLNRNKLKDASYSLSDIHNLFDLLEEYLIELGVDYNPDVISDLLGLSGTYFLTGEHNDKDHVRIFDTSCRGSSMVDGPCFGVGKQKVILKISK